MSEEQEMPKVLQNKVNNRLLTIKSLESIVNMVNDPEVTVINSDSKIEVILMTAAGQIEGEIYQVDENVSEIYDFANEFPKYIELSRKNFLNTMEAEQGEIELTGKSSSYVYLKNAVLRPWSNLSSTINYASLFVFTDDIISFSITTAK